MGFKVTDKDRGWKTIAKLAKEFQAGESYIKAGVIGDTERDDGLDNVVLAAVHEFGTANVPERSFIREPFAVYQASYVKMLKHAFVRAVDGVNIKTSLGLIGLKIVQDMRDRILKGKPTPLEPNAPSTIRAKGSSRPLVDSGQLVRSISYEVVTK